MIELTTILVPFVGTALGAAMVFFMKKEMRPKTEKLLLGFASGVMLAAAVWALLIPAMEMVEEAGNISWIPVVIGFLLGMGFLLLLDSVVPHLHLDNTKPEGVKSKWQRTTMMSFAVALHNLPEGMAVGVTFAGAHMGNTSITLAGALVLALGIAIQNFPEGAIISMPLRNAGASKLKAFGWGVLSGAVEPLAAILTILVAEQVVHVLPYLLSFAAGAMIYVIVEELIPQSQSGEHSNVGTVGVALGFVLMIIMDGVLG